MWLFLCSSSGVLIVVASVFFCCLLSCVLWLSFCLGFCGLLVSFVASIGWDVGSVVGSVCLLLRFLSWLFLLACLGVAYGSSAIFFVVCLPVFCGSRCLGTAWFSLALMAVVSSLSLLFQARSALL